MSGFIRCDHCGNTYGDAEPWCPHCLAPRPERPSKACKPKPEPQYETVTYFADNGCYVEYRPIVATAMPQVERR